MHLPHWGINPNSSAVVMVAVAVVDIPVPVMGSVAVDVRCWLWWWEVDKMPSAAVVTVAVLGCYGTGTVVTATRL
jgi:hypothetical protein